MNTEKYSIINGHLVLPQGIKDDMAVVINNGIIEKIIPQALLSDEDRKNVIDAKGEYVSPGFIDLHIHGGGGYDFMDGTVEAFIGVAEAHAKHGTTAMTPTTLTASIEEIQQVYKAYEEAKNTEHHGSQFLGIHLEGPFVSAAKSGAQDPRYLKKPVPENYLPYLDGCKDVVRITAAPELPGIEELAKECTARGIVLSAGHTDVNYDGIVAARDLGFSLMTHFYCAMNAVHKEGAFRVAGAVEAGYLIEDMKIEVIADGIHVPAQLLKLIYKIKGAGRVCLCTDALRGSAADCQEFRIGSEADGQIVEKYNGVGMLKGKGVLAGSITTCDQLVKNMVKYAGVPLYESVQMMSFTPAKVLGLGRTKGSLAPGKDADIVLFDKDINVSRTIIGGRTVFEA